ncbi:hypothetical protein CLIM01_14310 [Colletotrichum limetticola]|uniref:WW domain-containing protein n=1 Tax=Colletotrichum limetticola TaxID=1209924 RepID=A0ABQ9PB25_9PEZI|nr:hypothetical protein CLIM01_14310 [Colletotrichum limetticola]
MSCNGRRKSSGNRGLSVSKSDPSLQYSIKSSRGSLSQSHGESSLASRVSRDSVITSAPSESLPPVRLHQSGRCRSLDEPYISNKTEGRKDEQRIDTALSRQDSVFQGFSGKSPSQRDFEEDLAKGYWSWSLQSQSWYHVDKSTGAVFWVPQQLD